MFYMNFVANLNVILCESIPNFNSRQFLTLSEAPTPCIHQDHFASISLLWRRAFKMISEWRMSDEIGRLAAASHGKIIALLLLFETTKMKARLKKLVCGRQVELNQPIRKEQFRKQISIILVHSILLPPLWSSFFTAFISKYSTSKLN